MSTLSDDDLAHLKAGLLRARRQPMNFAVGLGKQVEDHRLRLHPTRAGRALAKEIRDAAGLKLVSWGTAQLDEQANNTLALRLEDRPLPGVKKKLEAWLKLHGLPIRKVSVLVDGREVEDDEDGEGAPAGPATAPTTVPTRQPDLAALQAALKQMAPAIQSLLQADPRVAAELKPALQTCQRQLAEGDAGAAETAIKLLARRLQILRSELQARPGAAPLSATSAAPGGGDEEARKKEAAAFEQTISQLEPTLRQAVSQLRQLQADPQVQRDRQALAETGARISRAVIQAHLALKAGDKTKAQALAAQAQQDRLEARKVLAPYWPKGAGNPSADWAPLVARLNISCPKDGAVFWSGDKDNAIDLAIERGGASLECTEGGAMIDNWNETGVPWSEGQGDGPPFLRDLWELVSASYALQAEGQINVVQTPEKNLVGGGEIWKRVERRILLRKELQGLITLNAPVVKPRHDPNNP